MAASIRQSPHPYAEPLRPQFHFSAQSGWINDPNGLVYFKGDYHLFFQHNPLSTADANKNWGHAVSRDLIHWHQLSTAIEPDTLGDIWSGSAVVDPMDTAGLGAGSLICMYTAAGGVSEASKGKEFTQCLVHSLDGRTFTKFAGNPVLGHIEGGNRDPKVLWYEPQKKWVLALYLDGNRYGLFGSSNLRTWTPLSNVEMPGASECPDFFELPLDGNSKQRKWVFWGASGNYRVGAFDGTTFEPETESIRSNFGNTSYAAQTFFNDPKGRRIQIGWLNGSTFPGCAWNQQLGFPAELKLVTTPNGPRLTFQPVAEIKGLRKSTVHPISVGHYAVPSGLIDIEATIKAPMSGRLTLTCNGFDIVYDASNHVLEAFGTRSHIEPIAGEVELRILVDRASIEIYAQHGLVNMPFFHLPGDERGLKVTAGHGWTIERLNVYELRSAW